MPKLGGDTEKRAIKPIENIWTKNNACNEHADDAWQFDCLADSGEAQSNEEDKSESLLVMLVLLFTMQAELIIESPPAYPLDGSATRLTIQRR